MCTSRPSETRLENFVSTHPQDETPLLLPGLPPLNLPDLPSFVKAPESYPAYLAMKLSQYSNLEKADWVFGNTFEKLEGEDLSAYTIHILDYLLNAEIAAHFDVHVFWVLRSLKARKAVSDLWPGKLIGPMVPSAFLEAESRETRNTEQVYGSTQRRVPEMVRNKATGVSGVRLFRKHGCIGSRADGGNSTGIEVQQYTLHLGGEGV
ncbi:hypothetical protein C3L33_13514, partial [Rhododendron williamsianum]